MEFRTVLETTGACRFYRPDPVPDAVLSRVLDGARWAPTGGNRQPVRFIVVRDPSRRRRLRDLYLPLWEQYAGRARTRGGAPPPRLLADEPNIREVIAFPLNQKAQDLLMQAPAPVPATRLRELHLKIDLPAKKPA